jgi:hypothetical protein
VATVGGGDLKGTAASSGQQPAVFRAQSGLAEHASEASGDRGRRGFRLDRP